MIHHSVRNRFMTLLCAACSVLILCVTSRGAPGDIRGIRVLGEADYGGIFNSWALEIGIEGLAAGGTYDLGLGKNFNPAKAKLVGHLQGWEFSKTLAPSQTLDMTIHGTQQLRKPFPDQAQAWEVPATTTADGYDGVKIIVALSEYIFKGDSLKVTLGAGLYTQKGVANAAVQKFPAINLSTMACPPVVGNWSWPDHQRFTGEVTLRAVGFHGYGMSGKPVQRFRFSLADTASPVHTVTMDVMDATIDATLPDANPVIEYVAKFTAEQLRKGQLADGPVVCHFAAYPCRTDAQGNGVLNTADGVGKEGIPVPQRNYYDGTGAYGIVYAVVDPAQGNDAAGVAASELAKADKTPYASIGQAIAGIRAQNKIRPEPYRRDNASGGVICLKKGTHRISGKRIPWPADPERSDVALEIRSFPGVAREGVIIGVNPDVRDDPPMIPERFIRFTGVTFKPNPEATNGFWSVQGREAKSRPIDTLWLDRCRIEAPARRWGLYEDFLLAYLTHSEWISGPLNSGPSFVLQRGNLIRGARGVGKAQVFLGNTDTGGKDNVSVVCNGSDGLIYAFNRMLDQREGDSLGVNGAIVHGIAIVQNLFERSKQGPANTPIMGVAGFLAPAGNVIIFHNTILGERVNMAYNDGDSDNEKRVLRQPWFERNNIFHLRAMKSDIFGAPGNGKRTGNWAPGFGVAMNGNINSFGWPADGGDGITIWGGYSIHGGFGLNQVVATQERQKPAFVDFKAQSKAGANDGAGNGDYHLPKDSVAVGLALQWVLPYDLGGKPRKAGGATGAYEYYSEW